jgi:hypothetical protein
MFSANGRTSACVNLVLSVAANWSSLTMYGHVQSLPVDLDKQDAFDGDRGVRVDDIVVRVEVLDKKRKHREELVLGELRGEASASDSAVAERAHSHLVAESVQEFDRVDNQDRMYGARRGLQVGEDVLPEEVDNVDKDIGGGDAKL